MSRTTRRRFLKGAGIGAAALGLPFFRPLNTRADGHIPKRFVTIFTPNGTRAEDWATGRGRDYELGPILRPLEDFKDRMLVLRGMNMDVTSEGPGGGHQRGIGALLTGQPLLEGDFCGGNDCNRLSGWAGGPSIDQVIARHIGNDTRFGSLELGVKVRGSNNRHRLAYRAANEPIPPQDDPRAVFDRLFGDAGTDPLHLQRLRAERSSVLDVVAGDLQRLRASAGAEQRHHLDAHLESVRDVEKRLTAPGAVGAACDIPDRPGGFDPRAERNFPLVSELQLDLLTMAFACDMTRVGTVLYSGATSGQSFPWLDINDSHHRLSHEPDSNNAAQRKIRRINRWYARQVRYLLEKLDAIPEGDGTMLDNTVVFWGNALARGNDHSRKDMSFVVAGSGGGFFRTGRKVNFGGRQHNDLLVTFCRAFGIERDRFGHPDYCRGPIDALV